MSRLKYNMSDAFLKKFLRLEKRERKTTCRGGGGGAWQEGGDPATPPRPQVTCETAHGNGLGGPAACQPADLR